MSNEIRSTGNLADLADMPILPVGARVFVAEDRHVYISVDNTTPVIAARLGWMQNNIWMPDHVLHSLLEGRSQILPDPIAAAAALLHHPASVHRDQRMASAVYFFADATVLRNAGLLVGDSIRYVDAVVESRWFGSNAILRLFHLSPRNRNQGGAQLWP